MTRTELEAYIAEHYCADSDHPWLRYPRYQVYRHPDNRKWFALFMEVPGTKLGLDCDAAVPIVNVKCDPILIGSLRSQPGFFPAYHMARDSWISIALDGSADDETIKLLLDASFHATEQTRRPPKKQPRTPK
ncbi:MAG: MmcQ/YjbR family DNA-binding protein [Clostridiales bacterium]|nr:MmcQ/YjbR family DNA-binding protein [Clostridiales bacterium]